MNSFSSSSERTLEQPAFEQIWPIGQDASVLDENEPYDGGRFWQML